MRLRFPIHKPTITKEDIEFVAKKLEEGQISGRAPVVNQFEETFASYLGVKYAVAVSNGTAALHVALLACDIAPGDCVAQPSLTMMSTAFAASYIGARILPIDVEEDYWCIDPNLVYSARRPKPKAIIAVHLYGNAASVDEISEFAEKTHVPLIEDCSEAFGARLSGRSLGTFGDVATFSFFSNKLITTGEGGMVATNDEEIAARARNLSDMCFGKKNKFLHNGLGYNYRMSAMQAALGLSQLRRAEELIRAKRAIGEAYRRELEAAPLELHPERPNSVSYPWMYSVLVPKHQEYGLRDLLMKDLAESGIETRPFFVPIHQQPLYARKMRGQRFPVSEDLSRRGLNLPSSTDLTVNEIKAVATVVKSSVRTRLAM